MEKIEGMVKLTRRSDTGDFNYDYEWQVGDEFIKEIIEKYEDKRIRVTIEEIPKDSKCSVCGEEFYSYQLNTCCICGKLICKECTTETTDEKYCDACYNEED
jgi:hypothetical protein